MALTYYDMEKLVQMIYEQKVLESARNLEIREVEVPRSSAPLCDRAPRDVRTSGATI
jgi:hypothetical protein